MPVIDDDTLELFRSGPCEVCLRRGRTDPHHLTSRGFGGGTRLDVRINLLALCRSCHDLFHDGRIPGGELLALVAKREGKTPEAVMEEIYRLRREPKRNEDYL